MDRGGSRSGGVTTQPRRQPPRSTSRRSPPVPDPAARSTVARSIYLDSAATARSPSACSRRWMPSTATTTRTSTAASTRSRRRRPTPSRVRAGASRRSSARRREEVVFTKNVTEAINLVAYSLGAAQRRSGRPDPADRDGAPLEHRPVAAAAARSAARSSSTFRSPTTTSSTSTRSRASSSAAPKLVCVAHVSNVLGHAQPGRAR